MKKILVSISTFLISITLFAQTIVIPSGNPLTTGSPGNTILRKPLSSYWGYERSAMIYTGSEIGLSGTITGISFYLDSVSLPQAVPVKVYVKETDSTYFINNTTIASEEQGATLVFNQTISNFTSGSYVNIPFSSGFVYNNARSLKIIVEANGGGTGIEGISSKRFRYNSTLNNKFQYWQADGNPPTSTGTLSNYRPNIKIKFEPTTPCVEPPFIGSIIVTDTTLCAYENVLLSIDSILFGIGQVIQWQTSPNGLNWTNINGANEVTHNASISADTYIRVSVTCGASTVFSQPVKLYLNPSISCYCAPIHSNSCSANIKNLSIASTSLNNNLTCINGASPVISFIDTGNTTATITKGNTYQFSITTSVSRIVSVWIDYNQNGAFDTDEWFQPSTSTLANVASVYSFSVPITAIVGKTGMRVRTRSSGSTNNETSSCSSFASGETHDYIINIVEPGPCLEPPVAGNINTNDTSLCPGTPFNLNVVGYSYGVGQTNQWQISPDNNSWTDLLNESDLSYRDTLNTSVYIRFTTTCGTSSSASPSVFISLKPVIECYCLSYAVNTTDDDIGRVVFNTIDNGSDTPQLNNPGSVNTYTDFTTISTTIIKGNNYPISVSQINEDIFYDCEITAYIDFNINGVFEIPEEQIILGTTSDSIMTLTANIDVPINALSGATRMRIVLSETQGITPCQSYSWGETEDYTVVLVDPGPCTDPPVAGFTKANNTEICFGNNVNLSLNGNTFGAGQTYAWQSSLDSVIWNDLAGASQAVYSTNTLNITSFFRCKLTCGSGTSYSVPIKVTVKPFNLCYCTSNIQSNACNNNTGILGVEIVFENFINYNQCTTGGLAYTSFPSTTVTDNLGLGQIYNVRVIVNSTSNIGMWIDYNRNGIYETSEYIFIANNQVAGTPANVFFTVPQSAVLGETGMRIRTRNATFGASDACTPFSTGETQDYVITIDNSVGIKSASEKVNLLVSPNPANQNINISGRGLKGHEALIHIYSINGALVKSEILNVNNGTVSGSVNVSSLNDGVYQVSIIGNNSVLNQKLVIQR
jgi:hypothetical protein